MGEPSRDLCNILSFLVSVIVRQIHFLRLTCDSFFWELTDFEYKSPDWAGTVSMLLAFASDYRKPMHSKDTCILALHLTKENAYDSLLMENIFWFLNKWILSSTKTIIVLCDSVVSHIAILKNVVATIKEITRNGWIYDYSHLKLRLAATICLMTSL